MKNYRYKSHQNALKRVRNRVLFLGLLLLALLVAAIEVFSQSAVNVGGGSGEISGNWYSFSLGEMTRIQTVTTGNLVVTEGILQPRAEGGTAIADQRLSPDALQVFPNPVSDVLTIQPRLQQGGTLRCRLTDIHGRVLFQNAFTLLNGSEKQQINVSGLAAGNYLLSATVTQDGLQYTNSFKIQKLR